MNEEDLSSDTKWEQVSFTPATWKAFKQAYQETLAKGNVTFTFNGHAFSTGFCKYFIEYHDHKFTSKGN